MHTALAAMIRGSEDFVFPAPQSDLSCWRVSAFQELLRWKEKQHMLEMQTHVIIAIKGTADENTYRMRPLYMLSLTTFMHHR